jgi:hypothetical protein
MIFLIIKVLIKQLYTNLLKIAPSFISVKYWQTAFGWGVEYFLAFRILCGLYTAHVRDGLGEVKATQGVPLPLEFPQSEIKFSFNVLINYSPWLVCLLQTCVLFAYFTRRF